MGTLLGFLALCCTFFPFPAALDDALEDSAMIRLEGFQLRKCGFHRQLFGVTGKHTGYEWIYRVIQEFRAQATAHEFGDGFFLVFRRFANEQFQRHSPLGLPAEQFCLEKLKRRHRQRMEFLIPYDVSIVCLIIGIDHFVFQSQRFY
ncbi:MAG: hypothetical protein MAGBODY4_00642 [Candidatus Marinimicrobia bacterium]|nr:hypothetical protein [Candidatus Neomarinimicrobiota bacterium]